MSPHLSYNLSLLLKEIEFDLPCSYWEWVGKGTDVSIEIVSVIPRNFNGIPERVSLPLWEDAKTWFIDKHDIYIDIRRNPHKKYFVFVEEYIWGEVPRRDIKMYDDYETARNDAYLKAIDLVKNKPNEEENPEKESDIRG